MKDRLIRESDVVGLLSEIISNYTQPIEGLTASQQCVISETCWKVVRNKIPVHYDLDKVKYELQDALQFYEDRLAKMGGSDTDIEDWGAIKRLKDALELVDCGWTNGGVDNGTISREETLPGSLKNTD